VLYGALIGSYTSPGFGTLEIRMGFSEFGPLAILVSLDRPITIDQASGLTISKISGGVEFGSGLSLPDPTVYELDSNGQIVIDPTTGVEKIDAKLTAFALRDAAAKIKPPEDIPVDQWNQKLREQIATLVKNGGGGSVSFSDLTESMLIYAHADLIDRYAPDPKVFRGDVNLIIDATGKILLAGTTTYADTLTKDTYFFGDLSKVAEGTGKFVFLMDDPGQPARANGGMSYYGVLDFGLVDSNGQRLTAAQLQDRYSVTKTASESYVWNPASTSILLQHHALKTEAITVKVGSVTLAPADYTIASGNVLTFTTAPAEGDVVTVDYSYTDLYGTDVDGNPIANPNSTTPDADGFQILLAGGVRADLFNNSLFVELKGQITITFTSTFFRIDVEAQLEVSYLGVIGAAAGSLTISYGNGLEIYGALKIMTGDGLKKLEDYGIKIQAQLTLTINTTDSEKDVDLRIPATKQAFTTDSFTLSTGDSATLFLSHSIQDNGTVTVTEGGSTLVEGVDYTIDAYNSTITLLTGANVNGVTSGRDISVAYDSKDYLAIHIKAAPESLTFVATGLAAFSVGGTEFFRIQGGLALTLDSSGFTLIMTGLLMVGPASSPLLSFSVTALIFAGIKDGTPGFAGMFNATLNTNLGSFAMQGAFLVQVNTFGEQVVFDIPNVSPSFPTIRDEKGLSLETTRQSTSILRNPDGSAQTDADGNVLTVPVTLRTATISGGAPRLLGGFEADAPYFVLRGNGTLNLNSAVISGQFYISLTPNKLHINMSGDITAAGNAFEAAGDFNLVNDNGHVYVFGGVLAKRKEGSADPLALYGVVVSGSGVILLNTDSVAHRVTIITPAIAGNPGTPAGLQEIDVDPGFVFKASVVASFRAAAGQIELYRIEGTLILQVSTNPVGIKLLIQGKLRIGPDSLPLLSFDANAVIFAGELESGAKGFAAMIHISLDSSSIPGVKLSGGFVMITNTFGEDVTFDIADKDDATFDVPTIVDENGDSVETERSTFLQAVDANGALLFDANGDPIWQLDGDGNQIPKVYRQVTITGAPPSLTGSVEDAVPYLFIRGSGEVSILDSFKINGGFGILLTTSKFQLSVNGSLALGPLGGLDAVGFFEISANGILGAFSLNVGTGGFGSAVGLEFNASFTLAVNTTGGTRTVTFLDGSTLSVDPGARVSVTGVLIFAGVLDADVQLTIQITGSGVQMDGTAAVNLAGGLLNTTIELHVIVGDNGFALAVAINARTNLGGVAKVSANGTLYINTGADAVTLGGVNITGRTVFFKLSGQMVLLEIFKMNITITAQVGGDFLRPGTVVPITLGVGQWAFTFSSSTKFFGIATVGVSGWIQYNGSFGISMHGGVSFGNRFLGFSAGIDANIGYDADTGGFSFGASAHGSMYIFGFGLGFSAGFSYNSATGKITLHGAIRIKILFIRITLRASFTIGYLEKPVPAYLGTDSKGNRLADGSGVGPTGELHLTMGDGATRNYRAGDTDTTYTVSHISTQADGSETVQVNYNGRVAEYYGVRKIIMDGGSGDETLYVKDGVKSQLSLNGNGGNDSFYIDGGSTNLLNAINGGDGDDIILVDPSNADIEYVISGGSGTNTLTGGLGNDVIYAGSGVDYITGGLGDDTIHTGTGRSYILGDLGAFGFDDDNGNMLAEIISGLDAAGLPVVDENTVEAVGPSSSMNDTRGGNDTIYARTGTNFIFGGAGNDRVYGGGTNHVVGDNGYAELDASGNVVKMIAAGGNGGDDYIDSAGATTVNVSSAVLAPIRSSAAAAPMWRWEITERPISTPAAS
jgi:hypothetical protein